MTEVIDCHCVSCPCYIRMKWIEFWQMIWFISSVIVISKIQGNPVISRYLLFQCYAMFYTVCLSREDKKNRSESKLIYDATFLAILVSRATILCDIVCNIYGRRYKRNKIRLTKFMLNCFKTYKRCIHISYHILDFVQQKIKFTMDNPSCCLSHTVNTMSADALAT